MVGVGLVRIDDPADAPAGAVADHGAQCADRGQAPQVARARPVQARQAQPQEDVGHPQRAGVEPGDEEGDDGGIAVPRRRVGGHSQVTQSNGCAELDDRPDHCDDGRQDEQVAGTPAQDGQGQGEPGGVVAQNDAHRRAEQSQTRAHGQQQCRAHEYSQTGADQRLARVGAGTAGHDAERESGDDGEEHRGAPVRLVEHAGQRRQSAGREAHVRRHHAEQRQSSGGVESSQAVRSGGAGEVGAAASGQDPPVAQRVRMRRRRLPGGCRRGGGGVGRCRRHEGHQ